MGGESMTKFYSRDPTYVLWNLKDYPLPVNADPRSIRCDIDEALDRMGFCGTLSVWVFGYQDGDRDDLLAARIVYYLPKRGENSADLFMPLYMLCVSRFPSNFWIIAKQDPERELHRVLQCVKSRNRTILVVDDTAQEIPVLSVQSLVERTHVLGGGKLISKILFDVFESDNEEEEEEDASSQYHLDSFKMEDFSKPITFTSKGVERTVVFWNLEDCPFPRCYNPDMIYDKIYKDLRPKGFTGEMSIWVYVDENNEYLRRDKTWESRIYFLPGGASTRDRMINDMLLWLMDLDSFKDEDADESDIVVVSDGFRKDAFLSHLLRDVHAHLLCSVYLVTPTQHGNKPERPEWPGLLLASFACPEGPSLITQRREADAAEETPEGSGDEEVLCDLASSKTRRREADAAEEAPYPKKSRIQETPGLGGLAISPVRSRG